MKEQISYITNKKANRSINLKGLKKIPTHILDFLNSNKSDQEKIQLIEEYTNNNDKIIDELAREWYIFNYYKINPADKVLIGPSFSESESLKKKIKNHPGGVMGFYEKFVGKNPAIYTAEDSVLRIEHRKLEVLNRLLDRKLLLKPKQQPAIVKQKKNKKVELDNENARRKRDQYQKLLEELASKITWDITKPGSRNEFKRQVKLLQNQEISFAPLSKNRKPYFKRGEEAKAAASLFTYWHENDSITGLIINSGGTETENINMIIEAFDMEKKKFTKRGLKNAFNKIKKGDRKKIDVFANLLNKK